VSIHDDPGSRKFGAFRKSIDAIQLKKLNGGPSDRGEADNLHPIDSEVLSPCMDPRMKKRRQLPCCWV
jgi:hypothetical protein